PTELTVYSLLEDKLKQLAADVATNPTDPAKRVERGDYLLDKGDLAGAIADFRTALKGKLEEPARVKARSRLDEAFTEFFVRDFDAAEKYLDEYGGLCKAETAAETRRRRANFLCLVGKGREAQGRLVEAFRHYLELGETAGKDELIQVIDEPAVR